jgi:hypothetical protein
VNLAGSLVVQEAIPISDVGDLRAAFAREADDANVVVVKSPENLAGTA